jgi:hypothetical protein
MPFECRSRIRDLGKNHGSCSENIHVVVQESVKRGGASKEQARHGKTMKIKKSGAQHNGLAASRTMDG